MLNSNISISFHISDSNSSLDMRKQYVEAQLRPWPFVHGASDLIITNSSAFALVLAVMCYSLRSDKVGRHSFDTSLWRRKASRAKSRVAPAGGPGKRPEESKAASLSPRPCQAFKAPKPTDGPMRPSGTAGIPIRWLASVWRLPAYASRSLSSRFALQCKPNRGVRSLWHRTCHAHCTVGPASASASGLPSFNRNAAGFVKHQSPPSTSPVLRNYERCLSAILFCKPPRLRLAEILNRLRL